MLLRVVDDERVVVLLDLVGWLLLRVAVVVWPLRISLFGREFTCPDVVEPLRFVPTARVAARWLLVVAVDRVVDCVLVVAVDRVVDCVLVTELRVCPERPRVAVLVGRAPPTEDDETAELPPCPSSPPLDGRSDATPLVVE